FSTLTPLKALSWRMILSFSISSNPIPPIREAVRQKYLSINFLYAYTFEEDITNNNIIWGYSGDGGATWDPGVYFNIEGIESHPAIGYRGEGNKMVGTFQGDPYEADGAIQYVFTCDDPTDTATYSLSSTIWSSSFPYSDRLIPDVAGYSIPGIPWWWGLIAVVGTRDTPGSVDMPIINYANYVDEGNSWSTYSAQYSGCENAAVDIDLTNGYYYIAFDYNHDTDWDILLMRGSCQDNGQGHITKFSDSILGGDENTKYPAIGAHDDYVIILAQTDELGTQDIVCYYSSDAGNNWDISYVAVDPAEDLLYPTIVVYGETATCTFTKNGNLYASSTSDGGATWDTPVQVNDESGTVNSVFRNVDITTDGNILWADNRNTNLDIFHAYVGGGPVYPILQIGEITGGIGKINAEIKNVGDADATDISWEINVTGGILKRINIQTEDVIPSIPVGETVTVTTEGFIFGLGKIDITVSAHCADSLPTNVEKTATGRVLLFLIRGIE
ncbi:MAG: hypothetical protein R6V50_07010, partial [Thermoplasmatota archaeon]